MTSSVINILKSEYPDRPLKDVTEKMAATNEETVRKISERHPEWILVDRSKAPGYYTIIFDGRFICYDGKPESSIKLRKSLDREPCLVCFEKKVPMMTNCYKCSARMCTRCVVKIAQSSEKSSRCPVCREKIICFHAGQAAEAHLLTIDEKREANPDYFEWLLRPCTRNAVFENRLLDSFESIAGVRLGGYSFELWRNALSVISGANMAVHYH